MMSTARASAVVLLAVLCAFALFSVGDCAPAGLWDYLFGGYGGSRGGYGRSYEGRPSAGRSYSELCRVHSPDFAANPTGFQCPYN